MKTLKIKYLFSVLSLFAMIAGIVFYVQAKTPITEVKRLETAWFNAAQDGPSVYLTDELSGGPSGTCSEPAGTICAIELDFEGANQSQVDDLLAQLEDEEEPNPTLQDFINAGASVSDSKHRL
jgi:hypothetical protein